MKTRRMAALLLALCLLILPVSAEEPFEETVWPAVETLASVEDVAACTGAALLLEKETGSCIYQHNAHARLAPASVTKIMTMLLVAEQLEAGLLGREDRVSCSAYAAGMGGSQIYLEEGEQMTVSELLKSVAVASANDAAVALAEHISGSEEAFVERMNQRAAQLGMADTVFANCTGLPSEGEHLTSAWDIGIMSRELLQHEFIKEYTTIWTDSVRGGEFGLSNTNKLVRFYSGATGLKTGFTQEAMYCLSASAMRDGVEYIAVILHAASSEERFESAKLLLNHAFANYCLVDVQPGEALPPLPVELGSADWLQPVPAGAGRLLLEKTVAAGLKREVSLPEAVQAPVAAGQQLGTLRLLSASGEELACVPLVAPEAVPRLSWGQLLGRFLRILCCGGA